MLSSDTSVMDDVAEVVSREDLRVCRVATRGLDHQNETKEVSLTDYLRRNSTMHVAGPLTKKLLIGNSCAAATVLYEQMR